MTELRVTGYRLLVLHFDDVSCAVFASDLVAIDHDGAHARITIDNPPRDLTEFLPHCSSSGAPMRLIIENDGSRYAFRTNARLELVETPFLYRMPRVLRDCGCAPWLRGIALLDGDRESKRPALWLDLASLANEPAKEITS